MAGISDDANPPFPELIHHEGKQAEEELSYTVDYDKAAAIAQKEIPVLQIGTLLPPASLERPIYLTGKSDVPLVRKRANRVYLNPVTYETVEVQKAEDINTTMWLNDIANPLHFWLLGRPHNQIYLVHLWVGH